MNKVFEILNVQPNITKSKVFKVDLCLTTKKIQTDSYFRVSFCVNFFEKKYSQILTTFNNKRTKNIKLTTSTKPKYQGNIILFETDIYGFDINNLDLKYEGFIKNNISLILDNINKLFFNFNLQYSSEIKPSAFSVFRILDSLKIIKADSITIFDETKLEEFYPEVFEIEGVVR